MRVPFISKNGSGKFGMAGSAPNAGGAGVAGQSAPVFSRSKTSGGRPLVAGGLGIMAGPSSVEGPPAAGAFSGGVNGSSVGGVSPAPEAGEVASPAGGSSAPGLPVPSSVPAPAPIGARAAGAAGSMVLGGMPDVVFASEEQATVPNAQASTGNETNEPQETLRFLQNAMRRQAISSSAASAVLQR
jgi:hypothetical protein